MARRSLRFVIPLAVAVVLLIALDRSARCSASGIVAVELLRPRTGQGIHDKLAKTIVVDA